MSKGVDANSLGSGKRDKQERSAYMKAYVRRTKKEKAAISTGALAQKLWRPTSIE